MGKDTAKVHVTFKYPILFRLMFYWNITFTGIISLILVVDSIQKGSIFGVVFTLFIFLILQLPHIAGVFLYKRSLKNVKHFLTELLEVKG